MIAYVRKTISAFRILFYLQTSAIVYVIITDYDSKLNMINVFSVIVSRLHARSLSKLIYGLHRSSRFNDYAHITHIKLYSSSSPLGI